MTVEHTEQAKAVLDDKDLYDRAISAAIWNLPEELTGKEYFAHNARNGLRKAFGTTLELQLMKGLAGELVSDLFGDAEHPEVLGDDVLLAAESRILSALITARAIRIGAMQP